MSSKGCLQKFIECLNFRTGRNDETRINTKKYSTVDTCVTTEYISPVERQTQGNLKYQDLNNAQILQLPTAEHDLFPGESSILINNCSQSLFFILRPSASVFIDNSDHCSILIGPSHGPVFIRNCKKISLMCISQQLRIQNSQNLIIESIVGSRPVLEYSRNIQFYSLTCELYDGVLWQMDKANINMFQNKIYEAHDFTPKKNNFKNIRRKAEELVEFEKQWEVTIEQNKLQCKPIKLYFPCFVALKSSMVRKAFTEKQIRSNQNIFLLCSKLPFKILLEMLSIDKIRGQLEIISSIEPEAGFKVLKTSKKDELLRIDTREGLWQFLLVQTEHKETVRECGFNIFLVEDKEVIWDVFSQL